LAYGIRRIKTCPNFCIGKGKIVIIVKNDGDEDKKDTYPFNSQVA
jgi:hypothetical protein